MHWLEIKKRLNEYTRQVDEGLINLEEFRRATMEFLASPEVEIFTLRDGYSVVSENLLQALQVKP
jgi:hypothetical protein